MVEDEEAPPSETPRDDPQSVKRKAEALIGLGKYDDAIRLIQQKLATGDSDSNYLLGVAAYRSGDFDIAHEGFRASSAQDPSDRALYGLGLTLRLQGKVQAAHKAFEAALRLNPQLKEAEIQLAKLDAANPPNHPNRPPKPKAPPSRPEAIGQIGKASVPDAPPKHDAPTAQPAGKTGTIGANEKVYKSLADMLDFRSTFRPNDRDLAGGIVWTSAPSIRSLIGASIIAILLLLIPVLLRQFATTMPAGIVGSATAWLWRISEAGALPAALFILIRAVGMWATTFYVLREHRVEIFSGIVNRQHLVIWLHDIERPVTVRQNLWQLMVGVGSIQIESTVLPGGRKKPDGRPNDVSITNLRADVAERIAARLRADIMWQRRRMIQNFVSSR
ncbi:PH domain-containing protein [Arthrobacter sp. ISL-28]|uniref:PH domain-containing protein n=1 Tax=Arthrobacter sp. ISL-28 TaxID=2819108 RepID=UPI001BEC4E2E|nr:PH domain-containing protein [Arthrobacter sp. ISL-28]MBT2520153.1 tetratricopeptide repeat protein [Arthrobacter sp. ISL-28]